MDVFINFNFLRSKKELYNFFKKNKEKQMVNINVKIYKENSFGLNSNLFI